MQRAGEKAVDLSDNVYWRGNIYQSRQEVSKDFTDWEHLEKSDKKDIYTGQIKVDIALTEAQIEANKKASKKPPPLYSNVHTGERAKHLTI